ncbi:hypothetical protein [Parabacteroides faecis]|uniref:hypothetical protein n=1 Tax=Parabacteroides faecis TaxID=1217282 RepID=UPI00352133BB
MKDKLYIDGIEVDLPEGGSGIVLNRAVSKPADMSTILSGYSYTIQLPKTAHNIQTFSYSTEVNVETDFPHVEHTAKVIRGGITLFDDGVAVVKSTSKTIEVLIKFGGNKRLTLLNDYKLKDIFPDSGLIPWDYSVTENDFVTWVPKLDGMQAQYPEHLRPAVKVSMLFDMIVGQSFVMNNAYRSVIEKMWLMLPTTNGSKEVADNLAFRLRGTTTSDQIAGRQKYDILPDLNYQNALYHQKLYDLMYRTMPVTFIKIPLGGRYRIKGTVKANNVLTGWKFGVFSIATEFKEGEAPIFDIFESASKDIDEYRNIGAGDVCFGIYDPFRTGNFEIDLTISFAPENEKDYSQTAFLLDYPIRENLPDISAMDFIKSVMGVFGLMVEYQGSILSFYNADDVILSKSGAVNISEMLIDKKDNKLEYTYGLTKKNILKYAEDDLVDKTFASYTFTADTYDKQENTVYQSPYAATDKNIALYTRKIEDNKVEYVLNKSTKCRLLLENGTESLKVWGKWIDADSKTVVFRSFTFEPLKYDNLVRKYWTGYLGVYANKPRISYRKAKLDPTFFPNLSFCKPLYADGNYYMLLSVNNYTEAGKADLELALIDGVDVTGEGETSLRNAILVNPTTPLKFSPTTVALYTAMSLATATSTVTDGKLIRELDEAGTVTNDMYLPVDIGEGDARKVSVKTIKDNIQSDNEGIFLRKDKPDSTEYPIAFKGGATFGNYVGGFHGSGARINEKGEGEMRSLQLWEFLEVPELRFNRIDVVSGELWNAIAFGLIESVDTENKIVKLKLEEGELAGLHVNDFCRGIFHHLTGNATTSGVDSAGFDVVVGFSTAYFTPTEIIDNAHFRYELKPGTMVHPCMAMKFAVYGNPIEKNRQHSAYSTRTYQRYLRNVSTWEINPGKHISSQWGDLSNLVINGESLAEGSIYLNNVYFGGNVWNVPGLENNLKGQDAYSVTLSTYSAVYNTKDGLTEQVDIVTGDKNVVTGTAQVVAQNFRISTKIQVSKGATPLRYSTVIGEGKYLVTSVGTGCTYTVTDGLLVVHGVTEEKAEIKLEINCEGLAVYEQVFTIVRVIDGMDGTDVEWIFQRSTTEANKPSRPTTSENVADFVPVGWTDDPVGPDITNQFEWSSKREKANGVWGAFSEVFLWSRWGKDGTSTEYIYALSKNYAPPAITNSQEDGHVPMEWYSTPLSVTAEYKVLWVSQRVKKDGVWSRFSNPSIYAKWAEDGKDGDHGIDGYSTYGVYRRSETQPVTPEEDKLPPSGWARDPPSGTLPLWMSKAVFFSSGFKKGPWSAPVRISGPEGEDGKAGPSLTFRKKYDASKIYTGTEQHVDAVYTEDTPGTKVFWMAKTSAGSFSNKYPSSGSVYWERFQGQFESIATGLALIEEANIAGWWFSDLTIQSQNRNVVIDGNADTHPRIALGASYENRDTAPTRLYEDGSVYFEKGVFGGYLQMTFKVLSSSDAVRVSGGNGPTYRLVDDLNIKLHAGDYSEGTYHVFVQLPSDPSYEGKMATIYEATFPPYTKSSSSLFITTQNGYGIAGCEPLGTLSTDRNDPVELQVNGACLQFMAVRATSIQGLEYAKWIALNYK